MLEDRLLGDAVPADRGENPGKGAGITVRGDCEDVVELLPGVPDPGERRVPGDPGERESDEFLPAAREGVLEDWKQVPDLLGQDGGVPVLSDAPVSMAGYFSPKVAV